MPTDTKCMDMKINDLLNILCYVDMDMSYTRILHPKVAHSVSHK
jgi:hypothetical protein